MTQQEYSEAFLRGADKRAEELGLTKQSFLMPIATSIGSFALASLLRRQATQAAMGWAGKKGTGALANGILGAGRVGARIAAKDTMGLGTQALDMAGDIPIQAGLERVTGQ